MGSQPLVEFSNPSSFILDQLTHKKKKYDGNLRLPKNQHFGQLKLFSNELLFILRHVYDSENIRAKKLIVYIGAGPGHHLPLLIKMFPKLEWHLYDSRFVNELRSMKNVTTFERYFEDKDMDKYIKMQKDNEVYLISDIRDLTYNPKAQNIEEEKKIFFDMDLQKKWVMGIKARFSMVKFRPPFPEKHVIEYLGKNYIEYLPGIIYKQPWAKITSVETRLVIARDQVNETKRYYLEDYESQMFYHNAIMRNCNYRFPLDNLVEGVEFKPGAKVDLRYDFAFTIVCLYNYFLRLGQADPMKTSRRIIKILRDLVN